MFSSIRKENLYVAAVKIYVNVYLTMTNISRVIEQRLKGSKTNETFKEAYLDVMNHNLLYFRTGDGLCSTSRAIPTFSDLSTHIIYALEYNQDSSLILRFFLMFNT